MTALRSITVCGGGLAGHLSVTSLARSLPDDIVLHFISAAVPETDALYGSVTSPPMKDVRSQMGVDEPDLMRATNTSFSLGSKYSDWPTVTGPRDWVQSFHDPLPMMGGVGFHHYLHRLGDIDNLKDYIMASAAAKTGKFVHPPTDKANPLSTMDYGFHFDSASVVELLASHLPDRVSCHKATITSVSVEDDRITALILNDGTHIASDLFIDCTGPAATVLSELGSAPPTGPGIAASASYEAAPRIDGVVRSVRATDNGWQSRTPLRGRIAELTVTTGPTPTGRRDLAWIGNCVGIGHAVGVCDPLTPAPMMMVERDIARLVDLIPVSTDMAVEAQEFTRQHHRDFDQAHMFEHAFFMSNTRSTAPYWAERAAATVDPRLSAKHTQFENRGVCVSYDYEPFPPEAWVQLWLGLGFTPRRRDPLADRAPEAQIARGLGRIKTMVETTVGKLPPHAVYLDGFLKYLNKSA